MLQNKSQDFLLSVLASSHHDVDDDNDNDNVKKQEIGFMSKTSELCTCITLCSTFLWRPLHDYDLEPPNATFYDFFYGELVVVVVA